MSKHTPGPWKAFGREVYAADGSRVSEDSSEANARLIAAAPDLKARLQSAIDALDRLTDLIDGTGFSYSGEFSTALDEIDLGRAALAKAEGA